MSAHERTIRRAREYALAMLSNLDGAPHAYAQGPAPMLCRCGADRGEHSGKTHQGRCERTGCGRFSPDVAHDLAVRAVQGRLRSAMADVREYQAGLRRGDLTPPSRPKPPLREPRPDGSWSVSLSDLGSCRRAVYYREVKPEGLVRSPEFKGEATIGSLLHDGVQDARRALYPWRRVEERADLSEYGLDSGTRHDEYDPVTATYEELKSAGRATWEEISKGPRLAHRRQAHANAAVLIDQGDPVEWVVLRYLNRERGTEEPFVEKFDPTLAAGAFDYLVDLASTLDGLADDAPQDPGDAMPRDHDGPTSSPICERCAFRVTCWNMPQAEASGRSPEGYTLLGEHPEADVIALHLQRYHEVNSQESEAKKMKARIKVLLDGVPPGVYGGWQWIAGAQRRDDVKGYIAHLRQAWNAPGLTRPEFDEVTMPKQTIPTMTVKPVRAAKRQDKPTPPPEETS